MKYLQWTNFVCTIAGKCQSSEGKCYEKGSDQSFPYLIDDLVMPGCYCETKDVLAVTCEYATVSK